MRRVLLIGVLFCLILPVAIVGAQDSEITPGPFSDANESIVTLSQLDISERVLRGPVANTRFSFAIPANWEIEPGAAIQVHLTPFFAETKDTVTYRDTTVEIFLNDQILETLTLTETGDQTHTVPIPLEFFDSTANNGRHEISLTLTSLQDCDTGSETVVVIHPTSELSLPHKLVPLSAGLTQFPYPIYQDSTPPDQALLVLPQSPTADELQAALNVAAGLGSLTGGGLLLDMTTEDALTDEMRSQNHLILVGQTGNLTLLEAVDFPLSDVDLDTLSGTADNDGLVRMAVSPWDNSRLVMQVGGFTGAGVIKASQAVSAGSLRPYIQDNISIVSSVQTAAVNGGAPADRSLADLGYNAITLESKGADIASFQFYISPEQALIDDAFLDLAFTHSYLTKNDDSNLTVSVNDQPIGSARLSDETIDLNSKRFPIPKSLIHSGMNQLDVTANFDPIANCTSLDQIGAWLAVLPESSLHLPTSSAGKDQVEMVSLQAYPRPFVSSPTLGRTTFVLPTDNLEIWRVALNLAFEMGRKANIPLSDLEVSFGDEVDQSRHLVLLGIPSETAMLQQLSAVMPLPFGVATNTPLESNDLPLDFRVPATADVGYLEIFRTPWDENLLALTVLGNSQTGLQQAASALLDPESQNQLWGNIAIADSAQLFVANSSPRALQTSSQPAPISEGEDGAETAVSYDSPPWILPALLMSSGIIILIIIVVASKGIRRRSLGRRKS